MRHLLAAALITLLLALPASANACAQPSNAAALEQGLIQWVNQQRRSHGLNALRPSPKLNAAAQQHGCDMAARGYFAHQRAGGPKLGDRVKANGYRFRRVAENLAYSRTPKVDVAANLWRGSPSHWATILKPGINDIGVSVTTGGGRIYWVMNVGTER